MFIYKNQYKKYLVNGTLLKRIFYDVYTGNPYESIIEILGEPYIEENINRDYPLEAVPYRTIYEDGTKSKKSRYYVSDLFNGTVQILNWKIFISENEFSI